MISPNRWNAVASPAALNETAVKMGWPMLCDETCDFTSPALIEMLSLWRSQAGNGIPPRDVFTARKLQPFMRNVGIYERVGEGEGRRYRIRLMGSGIVQHYGELTGKYIDEVVPERFLPRWYAASDVALATGAPLRLLGRADTFDKSYLVAEFFSAPLTGDGGTIKFALMGAAFDGHRPWPAVEAEARRRLGLPG